MKFGGLLTSKPVIRVLPILKAISTGGASTTKSNMYFASLAGSPTDIAYGTYFVCVDA